MLYNLQAFLSLQLQVVHIAASNAEAARLLAHYAAREQPRNGATHARSVSPAIAEDGPDGIWQRLREVSAGGAILVRPDGHVGWRCSGPPETEQSTHQLRPAVARTRYVEALSAAVKRILCR